MDETRKYNETLAGIQENFERHMELMRRSLARMKERTQQLSTSQEDKNGLLSELGNIDGWLKEMEASNVFFKARLWEANLNVVIARFGKMWTTEQDDWWLLESKNRDGRIGYIPYHVPTTGMLIIEDNDAAEYVIQQMKVAGNRIVTSEELAKLRPMPPFLSPPAYSSEDDESLDSDETASIDPE